MSSYSAIAAASIAQHASRKVAAGNLKHCDGCGRDRSDVKRVDMKFVSRRYCRPCMSLASRRIG